jgi:hypothetical protein
MNLESGQIVASARTRMCGLVLSEAGTAKRNGAGRSAAEQDSEASRPERPDPSENSAGRIGGVEDREGGGHEPSIDRMK